MHARRCEFWQGADENRTEQYRITIVHGQTDKVLHLGGAGDED